MVELARIFGAEGRFKHVMQLADFDYDLPPELIAKSPVVKRTDSRLMLLDRSASSIRHDRFGALGENLRPGDVLVLNDTSVIPARLLGHKGSGGQVEVFLNERLTDDSTEWDCLTRSSRPLKPGVEVFFSEQLTGVILDGAEPPRRRIRFRSPGNVADQLERVGHVPLPPYIDREDSTLDRERYQTVYARQKGALAAPTAGLHFTEELLAEIAHSGVEVRFITLHVGLGTFLPVRVDNITEHQMHEERFVVPSETAESVARAKQEGRRIVAVGTTVARTLESVWDKSQQLIRAGEGRTSIFIYPGFQFSVTDALLTNFHLPQSTLLMLVSAFADRDFIMEAYHQAITERYRFYSYGDCMLIQ